MSLWRYNWIESHLIYNLGSAELEDLSANQGDIVLEENPEEPEIVHQEPEEEFKVFGESLDTLVSRYRDA